MKDTAIIVVLLLLFALSHMLLSSRTIRSGLVARLGDKRFLAAYSIVALMFFVPLVYYYLTHRHAGPLLWPAPDSGAVDFLLVLANVVGFVLLVAGVMTPSPASVAGAPRDEPSGVQRITRHAVFMGMGIWALAHVIVNGYASDVAFFGGIVVFVLIGSWHQDRRKLAVGDRAVRAVLRSDGFCAVHRPGGIARADGVAPGGGDHRRCGRTDRAVSAPVDRELIDV